MAVMRRVAGHEARLKERSLLRCRVAQHRGATINMPCQTSDSSSARLSSKSFIYHVIKLVYKICRKLKYEQRRKECHQRLASVLWIYR